MALSRRGFLTHTTVTAASAPLLLGFGIDYCDATPSSVINWSMGFPEGAVLLNRNENPIGPSPLAIEAANKGCLLYTSPSPRDRTRSRMPSSA